MSWKTRCLAIACLAVVVTCAPVIETNKVLDGKLGKRQFDASTDCAIEGNADFYGLGIRIGIYLQWITAFLANHVLQEAIQSNLETNTIFLLALFVATVVASVNSTVQTAELVVLLHLCFGFLFSILSIWGHRTGILGATEKKIRFPLIGSFLRLILATALSAYAVWFWFREDELHMRPSQCIDYTFMFARVDVAGGVKYFLELQSSVVLFVYAILFAREFLMLVSFFIFVCIQTVIISGLATWFGASRSLANRNEKRRVEDLQHERGYESGDSKSVNNNFSSSDGWYLVKQWMSLSLAMGWKEANGKESAGDRRPNLKYYLIPFIDLWIFTNRTIAQYLCLVLFKWCPKIDFIPMMPHPLLKLVLDAKKKERRETSGTSGMSVESAWEKLKTFYESKHAEEIIYAINLICIIWTILSVELTIYWNDITGVYNISSTGQLIPFIIGAVGFVSLLHGVSVERSKLNSTDVLLGLLDAETTTDGSDVQSLEYKGKYEQEQRETYPMKDHLEAIFWIREPWVDLIDQSKQGAQYKRRHSLSHVRSLDYFLDVETTVDMEAKDDWGQRHLEMLDDAGALNEFYTRDNILECEPPGNPKLTFFIVKDFRKRRENKRDHSRSRSRSRSVPRRRSRSNSHPRSRPRSGSRSRSRSRPRSRNFSPQRGRASDDNIPSRHSQCRRDSTSGSNDRHAPPGFRRRTSSSYSQWNRGRQPRRRRSSDSYSSRDSRTPPVASQQPSRYSRSASDLEAASIGSGRKDNKPRFQRVRSLWAKSKLLAVLVIMAVFCLFVPLFMVWKIFRKPIMWITLFVIKHFGDRFTWAGKTLGEKMKTHVFKVVGLENHELDDGKKDRERRPSSDSDSTPESTENGGSDKKDETEEKGKDKINKKDEKRNKPLRKEKWQYTPHIKRRSPISMRQAHQMQAAITSRSLPILIETATKIADDLLTAAKMPQTAAWVKQLKDFIAEAKRVRQRKLKHEIGRTMQHEILADYYDNYVTKGIHKIFGEELHNASFLHGDLSEKNTSNDQDDNKSTNLDPGAYEVQEQIDDDFDNNAELIERPNSWSIPFRSSPWGDQTSSSGYSTHS